MRAAISHWSFRRALVLLAAANLLLGLALFALRSPQGAVAALEPPPPLPAEVEALRTLIAEGRHGEPYVLDLTEEELTATAAYFLASGRSIPFAQVRITVQSSPSAGGGALVVDAVTRGFAVTVPVRAVGSLTARDGLPVVALQDVALGDTPLPAFVRDQVLAQANAALDFSRYDMQVTVDAVAARPGGLTLRGKVK